MNDKQTQNWEGLGSQRVKTPVLKASLKTDFGIFLLSYYL